MINSMVLRRTHRRNSDEVLLPDDGKEGTMRSVEVKRGLLRKYSKKRKNYEAVFQPELNVWFEITFLVILSKTDLISGNRYQ